MSHAVPIKCQVCGANLPVSAAMFEAQCSYCGTVSHVQPHAPPPVPAYRMARLPGVVWIGILLASVGVPLIMGLVGVLGTHGWANVTKASSQPHLEPMRWSGKQPMIAHVNGDAVSDVIGWVGFHSGETSRYCLAAFDGSSGKRLWVTPDLGEQMHDMRAAVLGDKLLLVDHLGITRGYSIANGQELWRSPLGERAERLCGAGGHDAIIIRKKDAQKVQVNLATGQLTAAGPVAVDAPCDRLETDQSGQSANYYVRALTDMQVVRPAIDGISLNTVVIHKTANVAVALGSRAPGTRVPTAAAYLPPPPRDALLPPWLREVKVQPLWVSAIPTVNSLTVEEGPPQIAALNSDRVVIPYRLRDSNQIRVSALDLRTGRNLWDVATPSLDGIGIVDAIAISDQHVFVTIRGALHAFDTTTGQFRYTIRK